MTRIFWDTIVLISGYLFTFGSGPTHPTVAIDPNSGGGPAAAGFTATTVDASDRLLVNDSLAPFEPAGHNDSFVDGAGIDIHLQDSAPNGSTGVTTTTGSTTTTGATTTTGVALPPPPPGKKFVAVDSHFADCPDSHRHFCVHGSCRYLITEELPTCVCISGFMGLRCEHADLLAVVATKRRGQSAVAPALVLCVVGCVLIMLLCSLSHHLLSSSWLQRECVRRRSRAHLYTLSKPEASCCPSHSVV